MFHRCRCWCRIGRRREVSSAPDDDASLVASVGGDDELECVKPVCELSFVSSIGSEQCRSGVFKLECLRFSSERCKREARRVLVEPQLDRGSLGDEQAKSGRGVVARCGIDETDGESRREKGAVGKKPLGSQLGRS